MAKKYKIITSDMHLSAGRFLDGIQNPHEDFFFDDEFCEFLRFFSQGEYGDDVEVGLILNGDVFDFLNVPHQGDFPDLITADLAVERLRAIFLGHEEVTKALQAFVRKPGKSIVYNVGNHDMDFFFPEVQKEFCRVIGGENCSKEKVWVNAEKEFLEYDGIQIHHGNQFEAVHAANYESPFIKDNLPEPVLYLPWGSVYVIKIINRLKWEVDHIDKVKPAKLFMLFGLFVHPVTIIKLLLFSAFYFFNTRFVYNPKRRANLANTLAIMKEEITPFYGLEDDARKLLDSLPHIHTVIFGHTHGPMERHYSDGKTYINTGTWTRMINLDFRNLGQNSKLTFAHIEFSDEAMAKAQLREWVGEHRPHRPFNF